MAAKKSFADAINPAMQFITPPQAEAPTEATEAPAAPRPSAKTSAKPRAKKQPSGSTAKPRRSSAPEGYKPNPAYIETKSRRLQLLMQPSLHDRIKAHAAAEGLSVNEYIHKTLEEVIGED